MHVSFVQTERCTMLAFTHTMYALQVAIFVSSKMADAVPAGFKGWFEKMKATKGFKAWEKAGVPLLPGM